MAATELPMTLTTPLGPDVLLVARLRGHEAVSEPFHFQLDLRADPAAEVPFDRLVGQPVTLTLRQSATEVRHLSGIVSRFTEGDADAVFAHYQAEVVPTFALLTHRVRSRVFTEQSVPEIVKVVLSGLEVAWGLTREYPPRPCCVQYRESDLAFVSRLLEEEGIYYFFRHQEKGHQMVLSDDPLTHPEVGAVSFVPAREAARQGPRVWRWEQSQAVTPGKWTLWDRTFELPDQHLEGTAQPPETVTVGSTGHRLRDGFNRDLEVFDGTGGQAYRFDAIGPAGTAQPGEVPKIFTEASRLARLRMEAGTAQAVEARGQGDGAALTAGFVLELRRHRWADGKYLLTRVEHDAEQTGLRSREGPSFRYENRFTALPAAIPFRPARRTPRPTIAGTMTARVVGPAGKNTFLDKYGRVKVKFYWDRQGKDDGQSSCWLRVSQFWAGKRWGAFFWPRIGHEVVVAFEEGDPDRPLVVGSVYNEENMPPFELPAADAISGVKSCSMGPDADPLNHFNGLTFYDRHGSEHAELHSERGQTSQTETAQWTRVGKTNVRVVGGFPAPAPGSGSGGGDDTETASRPTLAAALDVGWGTDFSFVFGDSSCHVLGICGQFVVGSTQYVTVNPLGFAAQFGGGGGLGGFMTGALGGAMGQTSITVGAEVGLHYGPSINVHRGAIIEGGGSKLNPLVAGAAIVASGMLIAADVAGAASWLKVDKIASGIVPTAARTAVIAIWTGIESALAWLVDAEAKADHASWLVVKGQDGIERIVEWGPQIDYANLKSMVEDYASETVPVTLALAKIRAEEAANSIARSLLLEGKLKEDVFTHWEKKYSLTAGQITLSTQDPWNTKEFGPMTIVSSRFEVDARGDAVIYSKEGSITLEGKKAVDVTSKNHELHVGPQGISAVARGNASKSHLQLDPSSATLSLKKGLLPPTCAVELAEGGVKLSAGPSSEIMVTPTAITLKVGTNKIELTPDGISLAGLTLALDADLKLAIKTLLLNEDVSGPVNRQGAIVNIQ